MEDERFKSEMMRLMGTVINKLDGMGKDVQELKTDVQELKTDVQELKTDVQELKTVQKEHSRILENHSEVLIRLDAKTDNIAEKILNHEARLTKAEQNIEDLRGGVH